MTKNEIIAQYKKDYSTLHKTINGEDIVLTEEEYETTIEQWADFQIAEDAKKAEAETKQASAEAKLAALGLTTDDLRALGI